MFWDCIQCQLTSWGGCSRAHPVGDKARRRPNEQRVIASVSEDRTLLRIVDIGSSPTNPTSEKSLVDQGFFRFWKCWDWWREEFFLQQVPRWFPKSLMPSGVSGDLRCHGSIRKIFAIKDQHEFSFVPIFYWLQLINPLKWVSPEHNRIQTVDPLPDRRNNQACGSREYQ